MTGSPIPDDESARLDALESFNVLDSDTESAYDDIVRLASLICETPVSAISLVDNDRQWFKASVGLDVSETPREVAFCAHAIHQGTTMLVEDAANDERFRDNPLVTGPPYIRFYVGAPLVTPDGHAIGTLCIIDKEPRVLTAVQRLALETLSRRVMAELLLRRTNTALEEAAVSTRKMFEAALDAFVVIDDRGTITQWNALAEQQFGWSREEAVGRDLGELIVPPVHRPAHRSGMQRFNETRVAHVVGKRIEIEALHRNGHLFPVELAITEIRHKDRTHFSAFLRDITSRQKSLEDLREAKKTAEEATQAKSRFVANMSHEMRTPLNAIIGMASVLEDANLDPEASRCVDMIRKSGTLLLSLVSDSLDSSKLESGVVALAHQSFSLRECVRDSVDLVLRSATDKGLAVDVNVDSEAPDAVLGDFNRLKQVLVNLLVNAVKFTDSGGIELRVSIDDAQHTSVTLRFAVIDSGIGINATDIARIFDPFSQVHASRSGAGLGLAISRDLCQLMGGDLQVASTPGEGSSFEFNSVFGVGEESDPRPERGAPDRSFEDLGASHPLRILVVEDDQANQTVIRMLLERLGYSITIIDDGDQVLDALGQHSFDLVLMDVQMERLDGISATRLVRETLPPEFQPRIAGMTAFATQADKAACIQAGMEDFLTKPILVNELKRVLRAAEARLEPDAGPAAVSSVSEETLQGLLDQLDGDLGDLDEILDLFHEKVPERVSQLRAAHDNGDNENVRKLAHAIKGTTSLVGAVRLSELGHAIEKCIKDGGNLSALDDLVSELSDELPRTLSRVEELRAGLSSDHD